MHSFFDTSGVVGHISEWMQKHEDGMWRVHQVLQATVAGDDAPQSVPNSANTETETLLKSLQAQSSASDSQPGRRPSSLQRRTVVLPTTDSDERPSASPSGAPQSPGSPKSGRSRKGSFWLKSTAAAHASRTRVTTSPGVVVRDSRVVLVS